MQKHNKRIINLQISFWSAGVFGTISLVESSSSEKKPLNYVSALWEINKMHSASLCEELTYKTNWTTRGFFWFL